MCDLTIDEIAALTGACQTTAQHGKFIAHVAAERPWLISAKVIGIGRLAATDDTRLPGDVPLVLLFAIAALRGDGEHARVNSICLGDTVCLAREGVPSAEMISANPETRLIYGCVLV